MSEGYDFGPDAVTRRFAVGELLCEEGATDAEVFLVKSGRFDVERATSEGVMVVATVGPGQLVGEGSNTMGGSRSATLRATESGVVDVLDQDQFLSWLDANPDHAAEIADRARSRLNQTLAAGVLVKLFGLDNQTVVEDIVSVISWTTLEPGDVLFEQGDEADAAYLLIAGRLHLVAHDDAGSLTLDLEIGRGEIVGEMGIIQSAPRSASARAIRRTTLALISRESFERLSIAYPTLLLRVFHTIIDRLMHRHVPDDRAHVVGLTVTAPDMPTNMLEPLVEAIEPFGSTLHLSSSNLGRFVRNSDGAGGAARVAEFLHETDVAHDHVLLEGNAELTPWSISVIKQSDRYIILSSANPGPDERARIRAHLAELAPTQRASAWIARLHTSPDRPRGSVAFLDDFEVAEVHNIHVERPKHFARLGRLATGNGRGVVLGGGGAKGLAHIGALRALEEAGLDYDKVGGASMGSIIGGFAGQNRNHQDMLASSIAEFRTDVLDYTLPLVSLVKAKKMTAALENLFGGWDIADLWTPYYAVSTNLTTADLSVHRRGNLVTAMRASSAIPVVMAPVPIDGQLHVDGGVLDNVPVAAMAGDSSIGMVIAIDVSPPGGPAADEDYGLTVSGFDALRNRLSKTRSSPYPDIGQTLMSSMLIGSSKAKSDSIDQVDLYLDLDLAGVGLLKFENHEEIVNRGYADAKASIAAWLTPPPLPLDL